MGKFNVFLLISLIIYTILGGVYIGALWWNLEQYQFDKHKVKLLQMEGCSNIHDCLKKP